MMAEAGEETKLTVGGDKATVTVEACNIDLVNRDPNGVNKHIKIQFDDIFAEPDPAIFSFDIIWKASFTVFRFVKLWCYRVLTLICGLPIACLWGCEFAMLAFCHIWVCMPCLRYFEMILVVVKQVWNTCLLTFVGPFYGAVGFVFSNIHIRLTKE